MQIDISVITICFNAGKMLEKTVNSVISNLNENIEYIIVDGNSNDGTVGFLKEISQSNNGLNLKWVSEADKGIYDAMNKGISMASGNWLIFMNAGDTFYESNTINNISHHLTAKYSIIYGDMFCENRIVTANKIESLSYGIIMACHQSMFFNKGLIGKDLKYNLSYPIYADYELVVRIDKIHKGSTKYINTIISNYEGGGISDKVSKQKRTDKYKILFKHYGFYGVFKGLTYWIYSKIKN